MGKKDILWVTAYVLALFGKTVTDALISYLVVRELGISGADVARRMDIDRSSVSRALGRVQADPALKNMSKALLDHLYPEG